MMSRIDKFRNLELLSNQIMVNGLEPKPLKHRTSYIDYETLIS